jgi:ubiquinone/menaquinone biosynthesis C-methylase UbiE
MTDRNAGGAGDDLVREQYRNSNNLNARIALHRRFSLNDYPWTEWVFDRLLPLPPDAHILELGCGTGTLWKENAERIPAGWRVTLSDLSPGMLDDARRALAEVDHPFAFEVLDAQAIPYDDETFDAVVANHMLYHLPDRERGVREMGRVLKADGRFFATTVGEGHMAELWALVDAHIDAEVKEQALRVTRGFTLENGMLQLARHFSDVARHLYHDGLIVTEVEPLMAYIFSSTTVMKVGVTEEQAAAMEADARRAIEGEGSIRIVKSSGLFVASP